MSGSPRRPLLLEGPCLERAGGRPLRFKILIALLFVVTAIVSVITFTMATMFHEDKRAYVKDLVSIAVTSAADESYVVVDGYGSRLRSAGRALQDETLTVETKGAL